MKVLHINSLNHKGGAWTIIKELSQSLKDKGVKSYFIDGNKVLNTKIPGYKKLMRIFNQYIFMDYISPLGKYLICKKIKEVSPDIIHLHNIHGGIFPTKLLLKLQEFAPVVWTFHDMFPITGHCAHSLDCEKWKEGCGNCPNIGIYPTIKTDRTSALLRYKKKIYDSSDFTVVAPSRWLYDCVKKSVLKDKDIRLIYNGIDTKIFKKTDKEAAREKLSLSKDKKIVLFSAYGGIKNPFKGGKYIVDIYEELKNRENILFLNVGNNKEGGILSNWKNYEYVTDVNEMALLYSAADIFLFPTIAETFGLVVAEALACRLPVVTFDTGGVPEIVEHMKSGYVAKYKDSDDLLNGVNMFLNDENLRKRFGEAGSKRVRELFDAKIMAKNYYCLYCELLNKKQ
jgi:glycosyltransferase involved in cell wall biosynthesis